MNEQQAKATEILELKPSAADGAVAALVTSFAADPTMRWMWPDADSYLRNFPRLVRAFGGRALDHGTADASADFGSAALWLPPGVEPDGETLAALFEETLREPTRSHSSEMLEQMDANHTKEEHYYLAFIGVDAARQGMGVGSFLMQRGLARADAAGLHAYLESSNPMNVPFYRRHGFEVVGEIQVGASPVISAMLRPPA